VIQRFEFTFELFWKLLKVYLERQGILVKTPREALKEAFRLELLQDEGSALQMLDDRNTSVHIYDEATSREIALRIGSDYVVLFNSAVQKMN
jgi:nucleotidyltransferase substrate binding protein (TIGR01987 family)